MFEVWGMLDNKCLVLFQLFVLFVVSFRRPGGKALGMSVGLPQRRGMALPDSSEAPCSLPPSRPPSKGTVQGHL